MQCTYTCLNCLTCSVQERIKQCSQAVSSDPADPDYNLIQYQKIGGDVSDGFVQLPPPDLEKPVDDTGTAIYSDTRNCNVLGPRGSPQ